MKKQYLLKIILKLFFCCVLLLFSNTVLAANTNSFQPAVPIILSTSEIMESSSSQIVVNGLVEPGLEVAIYVNGKYNGLANISQINNNYSKFSFLSSPFSPNGSIEVTAISRGTNSSSVSAPASANVQNIIESAAINPPIKEEITIPQKTVSAPETLTPPNLTPQSENSCNSFINISGFTKTQTSVSVYIDDQLFTTFTPPSGNSELTLFSYSPAITLSRGKHTSFAIAHEKNGLSSKKSNSIQFCISSPQIITATSSPETNTSIVATSSSNTTTKVASSSVFQKTNKSAPVNTNKGYLNIIIFIAFLIGLLVWMIFVNRELDNNQLKQVETRPDDIKDESFKE